ncbi:MAG: HAD family phosphatase [Vicinamibacterales bacterium]
MTAVRAIVFDFDGVLADSEPLHLASLQAVLSALGVTLTREEYYANFLGYSDEEVFRRMAARHRWALGEAQLAALVAQKSVVFDEAHAAGGMMYPGARECIERLAKVCPLGIASGALRHEIDEVLAGAGLAHHFRFIVAAGDTSNSKPAPDPYRRAAELHGLPPSACVAIEDSRWGIQSAKAAGMKCVGITNTYPASELGEAEAIIGSLGEFTEDLIQSL